MQPFRIATWIDGDDLFVDLDEILQWEKEHPQPYDRTAYRGPITTPTATPPSLTWG